jgi:hypothetical protein
MLLFTIIKNKGDLNMAKVTHYEIDGKILCGTKAKTFTSSIVKDEVTCKRCTAKMAKSLDNSVKAEKTKTNVTLTFGACVMTFPLKDFDMFRFSSFDGKCCMATSIALASGQIKGYLKEKERLFFIENFKQIKESGSLTGLNVYNHFKG